MKMARDRFDLNAILADYFAAEEQFDPYANIDLSDADVDFSKLSTNAKLVLKERYSHNPGLHIKAAWYISNMISGKEYGMSPATALRESPR
jgi:hypothetical protein